MPNSTQSNSNPQLPRPGIHKSLDRLRHRWLPGWHSLRGRVVLVTILFCIVLFIGATVVQVLIEQVGDKAVTNLRVRDSAHSTVHEMDNRVTELESAIQRYLIRPQPALRQKIFNKLDEVRDLARSLLTTSWVRESPGLIQQVSEFQGDARKLEEKITDLVDVRENSKRLYPAMRTMLDVMLPANNEFYTAATLAVDSMEEDISERSQMQLYHNLSRLRHMWSRMIGAFRLFVANRIGVFGDPTSGMQSRAHNIDIYSSEVSRLLAEIGSPDGARELPFEVELAVQDMRRSAIEWEEAYQRVLEIFNTPGWRADLPLYAEGVEPSLRDVRYWLASLEARLDVSSISDIKALTNTGETVSSYLFFFALLGVGLSILIFVVFRRNVLQPISRVADALRSEAQAVANPKWSEPTISLPIVATDEIKSLVRAFDQMREQVRIRQQRLENILDNAGEGIVTFGDDGIVQSFNLAAQGLFYCTEEEAVGRHIDELIPISEFSKQPDFIKQSLRDQLMPFVSRETEAKARRSDGELIPISLKLTTLFLHEQQLFTGLVADISERKQMLARLTKLAERDSLTGLLNRHEFEIRLNRVVETVRDTDKLCAVLYMDLDQFKVLNDTCGHVAGDELLRQLAMVLRNSVRDRDTLARLGGDEFAVILEHCPLDQAVAVAEQVREAVQEGRFTWRGKIWALSVSIGVVPVTRVSESLVQVMTAADRACYAAKDAGRNRVHVYKESDAELLKRRGEMMWVSRINTALQNDQFFLVAQPIVPVNGDRIKGYHIELLLRMREESGEVIYPGAFLPAAERYNLMTTIDRWVVEQAFAWMRRNSQSRDSNMVTINLSGLSLGNEQFLAFLDEALEDNRIFAPQICFEVTETAAITNLGEAARFMTRMKQKGCQFSLDDFGSGLSSFAYLKNLPIDYLKIDGVFVKDIADDPIDYAMVRSINDMGHVMGIQTIAEWVESDRVLEKLREIGVDYAQGNGVAPPTPLVDGPDLRLVEKPA